MLVRQTDGLICSFAAEPKATDVFLGLGVVVACAVELNQLDVGSMFCEFSRAKCFLHYFFLTWESIRCSRLRVPQCHSSPHHATWRDRVKLLLHIMLQNFYGYLQKRKRRPNPVTCMVVHCRNEALRMIMPLTLSYAVLFTLKEEEPITLI